MKNDSSSGIDPRDANAPTLGAPFQLFLESKYATRKNATYENECTFRVPLTVVPEYQEFQILLKGFTIPVSWYMVDSNSNTLLFTYNSINYTMTLTPGNYSVTSFPAVFVTAFNSATSNIAIGDLTCSLNALTNKWTFTSALGRSFTFRSIFTGTSMFSVLGFPTSPKRSTTTYSSTGGSLVSTVPVDFSGNNSIYVQLSLGNNNLESFYEGSGGNTSIIGRVPVPVQFTGILNIDPNGYQTCALTDRDIGEFTVTLLDENRNLLQATLPWQININVDFAWNPKNHSLFNSVGKRRKTDTHMRFHQDSVPAVAGHPHTRPVLGHTGTINADPNLDASDAYIADPMTVDERSGGYLNAEEEAQQGYGANTEDVQQANADQAAQDIQNRYDLAQAALQERHALEQKAYETYAQKLKREPTALGGRANDLVDLPAPPIISLLTVDPFKHRLPLASSLQAQPDSNISYGTNNAGVGPTSVN